MIDKKMADRLIWAQYDENGELTGVTDTKDHAGDPLWYQWKFSVWLKLWSWRRHVNEHADKFDEECEHCMKFMPKKGVALKYRKTGDVPEETFRDVFAKKELTLVIYD